MNENYRLMSLKNNLELLYEKLSVFEQEIIVASSANVNLRSNTELRRKYCLKFVVMRENIGVFYP